MSYLGIDPGKEGGFALLTDDGDLFVKRMPVAKVGNKMQIVPSEISGILECWTPIKMAVIERQGFRDKEGRGSIFTTGYGYGLLIGTLATMGIPYRVFSPQLWKRLAQCPRDKNAARLLALALWPDEPEFKLKTMHGLAEAALMAKVAKEAA